jgi:hypothetical protein
MSMPPIPPLDRLGNRPFSFYPPILNIEHNEWLYRQATWSEILVVNAKSGEEVWVPRRFLGEISAVEDPVRIVGLNKELEYKGGSVWPHQRRVIEIPVAVNDSVRTAAPERPQSAPVVGIRLEPGAESRIGRLVVWVLLAGIAACIGVVMVNREGALRQRVSYSNRDQAFLGLRYRDDINDIVLKLGKPADDRFRNDGGEIQYEALWYPDRSYYVILMGMTRKEMHYIGSVDTDWNLVHYVDIPSGGTTAPLVRGLKSKRF